MTIAVHGRLPDVPTRRPPFVLVHGAANSAGVWVFWQDALAEQGYASWAVDLRGHGRSSPYDLSETRMREYADDIEAVASGLSQPPILMGWSMGGLAVLLAAAGVTPVACVGLAPSTPARRVNPSLPVRSGVFGPEEYGITSLDPEVQPAMPDLDREERIIAVDSLGPESRAARDERAAGIVVSSLPCPLLIATGTADRQWPRSRYDDLPLTAQFIEVANASHWGLVLSRPAIHRALPELRAWLTRLPGERSQ